MLHVERDCRDRGTPVPQEQQEQHFRVPNILWQSQSKLFKPPGWCRKLPGQSNHGSRYVALRWSHGQAAILQCPLHSKPLDSRYAEHADWLLRPARGLPCRAFMLADVQDHVLRGSPHTNSNYAGKGRSTVAKCCGHLLVVIQDHDDVLV